MKKTIMLSIAAIAIFALSFTVLIDKTTATVSTVDGISVFAYSKPNGKYDILGQVKIKGIVKNEKGPHMVELLVEYAKKDYPSGEAILVGSEFNRAEVIRFKD